MTKALNFFESRQFKIIIMSINVFLIVGLVVYIVFLHTGNSIKEDGGSPDVAAHSYTEEELNAVMDQAADSMVSIYGDLIPGSEAEFSDGNIMSFGSDGSFSGYFDSENPSIEGKYVVTASEDDYLADVNIYNGESSDFVQYKLVYDEDKHLMLYYPADNAYVSLNY